MIVILIGLSIIVNDVFKIDFPLFQVIFALIIIYFGVRLLFGSFGLNFSNKTEDSVVFSEASASPASIDLRKEYNVVFGSQDIDLRNLNLEADTELECNVVFGKQVIILPKSLNVRAKANAVFGNARFPDVHQVALGEMSYNEKSSPSGPTLYIEGNVVFGQLSFIRSN